MELEESRIFEFGSNRTKISDTLHQNITAFMSLTAVGKVM